MKTILITGVCGLIGSNFAEYLISKYGDEVEIIGIDDLSGGYLDLIDIKKIKFYQMNLLEKDKLAEIFKTHQINIIYHFAAYAAEGLSPFIRNFNYNNNLISTVNLINLSIIHNIDRFVFTSSMAVYGAGTPPFDESLVPNPIDPYGVAKYACEMDLRIAGEQHGLDWVVIRPHNVYGKYQNIWDRYRNVLGIWMYNVLNGLDITVYSDGSQERAFSYIDDIMEPLWKAGTIKEASKQIINLGGMEHTKIKDAALLVQKICGKGKIVYLESRHEVKYAYPTYRKSIDILGYHETVNLEEGLIKMWAWAQKQPKRPRQSWSEYELDRGIYSYWK